jgi:hypothetical protein
MKRIKVKEPIVVSLEALVSTTILTFCENLAELGCPKSAEPDMWFRGLSEKEMDAVGGKILDIQERESQKAATKSKRRKK